VAVLPFENLSPTADNAWFGRGIHEDVLTYLSRLPDVKVISRTSVMQFESSQSAIPEIARRLGATHIIEGSVRREGGRVRITVQLIYMPGRNTKTGS
jgi:TolB-like protein